MIMTTINNYLNYGLCQPFGLYKVGFRRAIIISALRALVKDCRIDKNRGIIHRFFIGFNVSSRPFQLVKISPAFHQNMIVKINQFQLSIFF